MKGLQVGRALSRKGTLHVIRKLNECSAPPPNLEELLFRLELDRSWPTRVQCEVNLCYAATPTAQCVLIPGVQCGNSCLELRRRRDVHRGFCSKTKKEIQTLSEA